MKTMKYTHDFFPTGKGLVITTENDEIILLYSMGGSFHAYNTTMVYTNNEQLHGFLTRLNTDSELADLGISQTGPGLRDLLEDELEMTDGILASIYEEVVGYNPFNDDPANPEACRELVIQYMTMDETLDEVFAYGKDK